MALKKCKECGHEISTKTNQCPNCGAPIKKKGKVLIYIVVLILMLIGIGKISEYFKNRSAETQKIEQQKLKAQLEAKKKAEFMNAIDEHYTKLTSSYNAKDLNQATQELNLFIKYNKLNYKDVGAIWKKIRISELEKKIKGIPAVQVAENLRTYKQLLNLDPNNKKYKRKVAQYQAKIDEQKRGDEQKRIAYANVIKRFGTPPENSAWDGSVRCVKNYLKEVANDPDSLKFEKWGKVTYNDTDGWLVWCQFRGKNAFGGYVRNVNWFVIQHNMVVDVKEISAYR